jgi:hypothetical protein
MSTRGGKAANRKAGKPADTGDKPASGVTAEPRDKPASGKAAGARDKLSSSNASKPLATRPAPARDKTEPNSARSDTRTPARSRKSEAAPQPSVKNIEAATPLTSQTPARQRADAPAHAPATASGDNSRTRARPANMLEHAAASSDRDRSACAAELTPARSFAMTPATIEEPKPEQSSSVFRPDSDAYRKMVELAAYLRAERSGFTTDPMQDWLAAEREVNEKLRSSLN